MITITMDFLKSYNACDEGIKYCNDRNYIGLPADEFAKKLIADNRFKWANWLIIRLLTKVDKVKYAVFAAEQVLSIWEEKYSDDLRPRTAIEAAKKYIDNAADAAAGAYAADAAAYAAAYAAGAVAYAAAGASAADAAAYAAAYAAGAVDYAAAYAAAYAAGAVAYAAADAAGAAASAENVYDKVYSEIFVKILNYGIELM